MNAPTRLVAFVVGLVAVFGAALGVGRLVGPVAVEADNAHRDGVPAAGQAADLPDGLQVSERGYTLQLSAPSAMSGPRNLAFTVLGQDGRPIRDYAVTHERELHLVLVRRDLSGYRHLHPARDRSGTWTTPVYLSPGVYRVIADFQPRGEAEALVLGVDLAVSGNAHPGLLPEPSTESGIDGYLVTIDGKLAPATTSRISFDISRNGAGVNDLQPYLGASGHLVALRAGDLAYLHVHALGDGLAFDVEVPSPSTYGLFLDFKHRGVVRTAEFTAVARAGAPAVPTVGGHEVDDGHGD